MVYEVRQGLSSDDASGDRSSWIGQRSCKLELLLHIRGQALRIPENQRRREKGLAVLAVQHIRRMRGGAQGQLMLGSDGHAYVVKFQNNPQHMRVLANEFLATRLAAAAGSDGSGGGVRGGVELAGGEHRRNWRSIWGGRGCAASQVCNSGRGLWAG